jgi:hypothetical protein
MMELFLSSDGRHTVHVAAQTPEKLIKLLPRAKFVYEAVVRAYDGNSQKPANGEAKASASGPGDANGKHVGEAPLCQVHKTPVAYQEGRYAAFWACPTKTADGGWRNCTFEVKEPMRRESVAA